MGFFSKKKRFAKLITYQTHHILFLLVNFTLDAGEEAECAHAAHIWCICGRLVGEKKAAQMAPRALKKNSFPIKRDPFFVNGAIRTTE